MGSYKYVMFEATLGDVVREFPVIFPEELVHSDVAEAVCYAVRTGEVGAGMKEWSVVKPVRAGFIQALDVLRTYGESESLELKSSPEDAKAIVVHPYTKGHK